MATLKSDRRSRADLAFWIYYHHLLFLRSHWWHTRLTSWHGLYLPGSEGRHSYQLLLIALKIPQPQPAAKGHSLLGRSASFRAWAWNSCFQSCSAEVNDTPIHMGRCSALLCLSAFCWGLIRSHLSVLLLGPWQNSCTRLLRMNPWGLDCLFRKSVLEKTSALVSFFFPG